jgi:DNA-binding transcriptional LysR family regulator
MPSSDFPKEIYLGGGMRFDLADLRLFLCVVDAGSITAGARQANLALASASERIGNIESYAGVVLLERSRSGVATTEAGEALAHHARLILRQHSLLQGELRDFGAGARGTLLLYANTSALTDLLPQRLAPWLAQRPHLYIDLRERTSAEIVKMIGAGLAEAGVVSDAVNPAGLTIQPVASDHLVLIVPVAHRLAESKEVCFADITGEQFVGLEAGSALQDHIDEHAADLGKTLSLRIRVKNFEGACQMVSQGVGVAIIPLAAARRFRRRYPFKTLVIRDDWARRQLCLCFQRWHTLSTPMQSLLAHLGGRPENPP